MAASGTSKAEIEARITKAEKVVEPAIREISHIATLPEVTTKIMDLIDDPNATAQDLNLVIQNDPALGARILKVVNSAFYGVPAQVGSINRAIVLLGLNAIKNIAIAASLTKLFRSGKITEGFSAKDLWLHSIATAAGARLLVNELSMGYLDEAFLAGLIHDLGLMVEIQSRRPKFIQCIETVLADENISFREVEFKTFNASHEDFGRVLARSWKFPPALVNVIGGHHEPERFDGEEAVLPTIVAVADCLAAKAGFGFTRGEDRTEPKAEWLETLGLEPEAIDRVLESLPAAYDEASALMNG
ncbi:HDOD domain-containing protein [Mucisphaera calidilacus]|uniref:Phosphodiesterase n=1 Tax=Mucisphaera calidilacus TaxID=2527982 RepID=A0A518BTN9_9BACT|nr:HDOD domain-containing protein [Mucisphaera calidilacus]QDU70343.1 phosphodiesterase [Mucisphaera calidilacus]